MVGSAAITAMVLPPLFWQAQVPLPAPLWVISLAGLAQSALLLALAVWAGVRLTPSVGLRAPAFEAVVTDPPIGAASLVERSVPSTDTWWGYDSIQIVDPDGNELLFPTEGNSGATVA